MDIKVKTIIGIDLSDAKSDHSIMTLTTVNRSFFNTLDIAFIRGKYEQQRRNEINFILKQWIDKYDLTIGSYYQLCVDKLDVFNGKTFLYLNKNINQKAQ